MVKQKNYGVCAQKNFIVQIQGAVISTAYGLSILSLELQLQLQLFVTGYHWHVNHARFNGFHPNVFLTRVLMTFFSQKTFKICYGHD